MRQTYDQAIAAVFRDEGGYSNVSGDHGGPTNYGITIADYRRFLKPGATAEDVKNMSKAEASQIYREHYANPIQYDNLPAGVDYAILDFCINSGIGKASVCKGKTIDQIYDLRESFLKQISQHPGQEKFLKGWLSRTKRGRALAHKLEDQYGKSSIGTEHSTTGGVIVAGGMAASQYHHLLVPILIGTVVTAIAVFILIKYLKRKQ